MEYKEIAAAILTSAIVKQSSKQSDKLINYACDTYKEILSKLENDTRDKENEKKGSVSEESITEEPKKKRKRK